MPVMKDLKDFLRGNPKLKAPGYKEFVPSDVILERMSEMKKIMDDPIYFAEKYFYIITTDGGKQLIKIYPKQGDMIKAMCNTNRNITLACRQCRKMFICKYKNNSKKQKNWKNRGIDNRRFF